MGQTVMSALINNAALLLVLSLINEISNWIPKRYYPFDSIIKGLLAAIVCFCVMSMPFTIKAGIIFDTRSILISVVALTFGFLPTTITASVAVVYRIYIGGSGVLPGIAVIVTSALIGLAWRRWLYPGIAEKKGFSIYAMSIIVHSTMLLCMLLLPYPDNQNIIRAIAFPVMIIYPVASVLLGVLLIRQQERKDFQETLRPSEDKHRRLFETMAQGVVYQDAKGAIISANPAAERILGLTLDEMNGKTSMDLTWKSLSEDGSQVSGKDHPSMIALRTGKDTGPCIMSVFQPKINDRIWLSIYAIPLFLPGKANPFQVYTTFQDITAERNANQNYELLFNTMVDAFALHEIVFDSDRNPINYRFLSVNPAFELMTGLKADDIVGKTVLDVLPDTEPYWVKAYGQVVITGNPIIFENYSAALKKHFIISAYRPAPNQFACTFLDITERMAAQAALKESEAKYSSYIENAPSGIVVVDESGRFIEANNAILTMTGYTRDEFLQMDTKEMTDRESFYLGASMLKSLKEKGFTNGELKYMHKDGRARWACIDAVKLSDDRFLSFFSDITDKKTAEDNLIYISRHDYLTGLYNRRYFEEETLRLNVKKELPLSIIVADINGVKLINDSFGRTQGDKIIADTAKLIGACCNRRDVLARTGGDEFSLLMPRAGSKSAEEVLKKIKNACKEYNANIANDTYHINLSLGLATKESMDIDFVEICKTAEDHMNQGKLLEKKSSHSAILSSIKATMMEKSHETEEHAERLSRLSRKVGLILGLSQIELDHMELLATLHDIGKVGISEQILNKRGRLNEAEWVEMKKHSEIGYRIAMSSANLATVADYILYHHERWDGQGYPQKLVGENIPLLSRILAVVDAYDAMTQDRPYRKAMSAHKAIEEIQSSAGTQFDPKIVDIFIHNLLNVL